MFIIIKIISCMDDKLIGENYSCNGDARYI